MKIDAVITWVDGDDPRHRAKRQHGAAHCQHGLCAGDRAAHPVRHR